MGIGRKMMAMTATVATLLGVAGMSATAMADGNTNANANENTPAVTSVCDNRDTQTTICLKNAQYGHIYSAFRVATIHADSVSNDTTVNPSIYNTNAVSPSGIGYEDDMTPGNYQGPGSTHIDNPDYWQACMATQLDEATGKTNSLPTAYKGNFAAYMMSLVSNLTDQTDADTPKNSSGKKNEGKDADVFSKLMNATDLDFRNHNACLDENAFNYTATNPSGANVSPLTNGDAIITGLKAGNIYVILDSYNKTVMGKEGRAGVPMLGATTGVYVIGDDEQDVNGKKELKVTPATKLSDTQDINNVVYTKSEIANVKLYFKKVDAADGTTPVNGATFEVTGGALATGEKKTFVSGADKNDGMVRIEVPFSTNPYTIKETSAPDGYKGYFHADYSTAVVTLKSSGDDPATAKRSAFYDLDLNGNRCFAGTIDVGNYRSFANCVHDDADATGNGMLAGDKSTVVWDNIPDGSKFPLTGLAGSAVFFILAAGAIAAAVVIVRREKANA